MINRLIILLIVSSLIGLSIPTLTNAFGLTDIKNTIDAIKAALDWAKVPTAISGIANYIPHNFPFGGYITSSENACEFKFRVWVPILCILGVCSPPLIPLPDFLTPNIDFGTAIEVSPPIPTNGKVMTFPFISELYRHGSEGRVGPWTLGLGFTPFPLDRLNDALKPLRFPNPLIDCSLQWPTCFDNFRIECVPSGEKDLQGHDIYKVIRLLGTSKENAPQNAIDNLKNKFPSFPWPL